jgi:hypothetical protein
MDQSPWEATSSSASQEIPPALYGTRKYVEVHYRVHHFVPILISHRGQYRRILGPWLFATCGSLLRLQHESTKGYFAMIRLFVLG